MTKHILLLFLLFGLSGLWACAGRSTTARDQASGTTAADEYIADHGELQTLYQELLTLKDDPAFASQALDPGTPSATWMERTRQARDRSGSMTAFTDGTRVLLLLGVMYKQTGGQENDLTASMRRQVEANLETLKIRNRDVFQIVCSGQTNGRVQAIKGCCSFDGGLAARVHYFEKELGGKSPRTLLLDNGNAFAHEGDQADIRNELVVRVMNELGYDVMGLGPRDLSLGHDGLRQVLADADFPVVATNLRSTRDESWFKPWVRLVVGDTNFVVFSLLPMQSTHFGLSKGDQSLRLEDPETALAEAMAEAIRPGDFVVVLSQCSVETNRNIVKAFPDIKVIVTAVNSFGGTDRAFTELVTERYGRSLGLLRFLQQKNNPMAVLDRKTVAMLMANAYFDPATQEMIDKALGVAK